MISWQTFSPDLPVTFIIRGCHQCDGNTVESVKRYSNLFIKKSDESLGSVSNKVILLGDNWRIFQCHIFFGTKEDEGLMIVIPGNVDLDESEEGF